MSRTVRATAREAIDVVEAGYSLEGTETEWLARVLDAAKPNFDLGRGYYGFTCRIDGSAIEMNPVYVERSLDPRWGALVEKINREAPGGVLDVLARNASICGGFSEVLGNDHPGTHHFLEFGRAAGITDALSIFAQDAEGFGIDVSAPIDGVVETSPRVRGIWRRVSLHVAAGMRLRRKLAENATSVDAILEPGGKVEHAAGAARESRSARDALMRAVKRMERARTSAERRDPKAALDLWQGLVAGEWSLVERWESDGRRYIAAHANRPNVRDPRALSAFESTVLRYVVLGASNKEIAFTLGVPIGSIGSAVSELLRKLRCRRRTDLVSLAVTLESTAVDLPLGDDSIRVASTPRRRDLLERLSLAEREIAERVLEGAETGTIARERRTSVHTVGNQLRQIFAKLGVKSRAELARKFAS